MIPRIKRIRPSDNHPFLSKGYMVRGKYGWDSCETLGKAIRYWLWHCGVSAKVAFMRWCERKQKEIESQECSEKDLEYIKKAIEQCSTHEK